MIGTLIKAYAYSQEPKTVFTLFHPIRAVQWKKVPFDLKTAYAPRLTALGTALIVGPLAFRLGKRAAEGTLWSPADEHGTGPAHAAAAAVP